MASEYLNDKKAKKAVMDPAGDAYSVKSGAKKWRIFLYGCSRFVKVMEMLYKFVPEKESRIPEVLVYRNAIGRCGNWMERG